VPCPSELKRSGPRHHQQHPKISKIGARNATAAIANLILSLATRTHSYESALWDNVLDGEGK